MKNYRVLVADEAMEDIFELVRYIYVELRNPDAAEKLYHSLNGEIKNMGDFPLKFSDSGMEYRGYAIHKKIYGSYLIFYIISNEKREVYVLRVLKELVNWQKALNRTKAYHFSYHGK